MRKTLAKNDPVLWAQIITGTDSPYKRGQVGEQVSRRFCVTWPRGLKGVQLIISDACRGLTESAAEYLPEARWQRCTVHFYRNVFSQVPATKVREVRHMLKAIHAQESRDAADRKARAIVVDLRTTHQQPARADHASNCRRTRVVGAFPDGQSCLNLAAARLRYIVGTAWSTKCYMNMRPLYQPQLMQTEAIA